MVDIPLLKSRVIEFLSRNGPSLPLQVSKVLVSDSFFAGAILSELIAEKKIKITTAKIGRSCLYYMPGQEDRLSAIYPHLPDKEKEAYTYLQEKRLVRDREAIPSVRVAFRMMKDFAFPVMLKIDNTEELCWKWHLLADEEFKTLQQAFIAIPISAPVAQPTPNAVQQQKLILEEKPAKAATSKPEKKTKEDDFSRLVSDYLAKNNLKAFEQHVVRKNQEFNCVVRMNTPIGDIDMLLVAKNKKSISDADLTLAHQKGLSKKMLTVFLTTGTLAKKAREHLEKHLKGYVLLRELR